MTKKRPAFLNSNDTIAAMICLLAVPGCSDQATSVVAPPPSSPTDTVGLEISTAKRNVPRIEPSSDGPSKQDALASVEIPENVDFFSMPRTDAPRNQSITTQSEDSGVAVRLVGFLNANPSDPESSQAILRIGDETAQLSAGQSLGDTTLVSIGNRSVTIQQTHRRWTIDLFHQEVTTRPTVKVSSPQSSGKAPRSPGALTDRLTPIAPGLKSLAIPAASESMPSMPDLKLPSLESLSSPFDPSEAFRSPELPELPGLPGT